MDLDELCYRMKTKRPVAQIIKKYASYIPSVSVSYQLKPIAQTVLQINLTVKPTFEWNGKWHSGAELFWVIVDNEKEILHMESFVIKTKQVQNKQEIAFHFFLPYRDNKSAYYRLIVVSDSWQSEEDYMEYIDLKQIQLKGDKTDFTELQDLQPLPKTVLHDEKFESLYPMKFFNPNQTQVFHSLFHTNENVLIGSPTGSGKTIMSEFAILRNFKLTPQKKVVYIAPMKALAKERLLDWINKFGPKTLEKEVIELTGDSTPDYQSLIHADIIITTPEKWDGISRNWSNRSYVQQVGLVIFDEIHLLGQDRGPVIEVIVSRMNMIGTKQKEKIRMVGLSTAMANGSDVADWFNCPQFFFFNFRPHVRPIPITIYFDGFSEKNYCPRMATMNKPAFNAIKKYSDGRPTLIFVSSRRQTRLTALDIIAHAMHETAGTSTPFIKCSQEEIDIAISCIKDEYLVQSLSFGVGMHHAGLTADDKRIVEQLFVEGKIQILIATSTLAWGVNFPARLVIIKGTEYFDPKSKKYVDMPVTDILQMIGRAGRPGHDDKGIACVFVEQSKKNFYRKYLNDPFPIESQLINQLEDHFNAEIASGTILNKQQCVDWITWTYFFRRLLKNPSFYGLESTEPQVVKKFLLSQIDKSMDSLKSSKCIKILEDGFTLEPTFLGQLASFYYIKHETIFEFDKKLSADVSIPELIRIISYAKEFEEVPLRHNEENMNEELAKSCPLSCNKKAFDNPNEKTYLLFQAHLFRLPLPIRDYVTDTKIVIDSSIRIIHSLIDLAAEKMYLKTTLNLTLLMQMIIQGCWFDKSALTNVPHFTPEIIKKLDQLKKGNCKYLFQLVELHKINKLEKNLFRIQELTREQEKIKNIIKAVETVPVVNIKASIKTEEQIQKIESQKKNKNYKKRDEQEEKEISEDENEQLQTPGEEATVYVELSRENFKNSLNVKIQATNKHKDASFWVIIGDEAQDKLLALKKISFKKIQTLKMLVQLPEDFAASPEIKVYLISDSYIGIDQEKKIKLIKKIKFFRGQKQNQNKLKDEESDQ